MERVRWRLQNRESPRRACRYGNPTTRVLEEKIAALEGAEDCVVGDEWVECGRLFCLPLRQPVPRGAPLSFAAGLGSCACTPWACPAQPLHWPAPGRPSRAAHAPWVPRV